MSIKDDLKKASKKASAAKESVNKLTSSDAQAFVPSAEDLKYTASLSDKEKADQIMGAQFEAQLPGASKAHIQRSKVIVDQAGGGVHFNDMVIPPPVDDRFEPDKVDAAIPSPGAVPSAVTAKVTDAVMDKLGDKGAKAQKALDKADKISDASSVMKNSGPGKADGVTAPPADIAEGVAKINAKEAMNTTANATPSTMYDDVLPPKAELPKRTGFIPNPHYKRTNRTDKKRGIRLRTQLGQDALMVTSATLSEAMSENFSYELNVFSEQFTELKPKDLVGTKASIYLFLDDNKYQVRNGYITHLSVNQSRQNQDEASYRIIIEPWLAMLKSASNCRIFQHKTVIDVINELFSDVEGAVLDTKLLPVSAHQKYEYWVQYNESRLDYLNRICHVEGIGYYYTHEESSHTLTFFDNAHDLGFVQGNKPLVINPRTHDYDHLDTWNEQSQFVVGKTSTKTYNYLTPSDDITTHADVDASIGQVPSVNSLESYQYSEDHQSVVDGQYESTRQNHRQGAAKHLTWLGRGNYRHLRVGDRFNVTRVPKITKTIFPSDLTIAKLVIDIEEDNNQYITTLEALPPGAMRTPPAAKQHIMRSQETARVTGPAGSEVHMDALGRIKVQFHWDRYGKNDENTSCWMRVMNNFAGSSYGVQFTPRVGQEVVVAYENGNLNRPFISGGVYNSEHTPPFVDDSGLRSGIRTRSSKGGGPDNYNEISFFDQLGGEQFDVQAERNMNVTVKNDLTVTVGHNEKRTVGKTLTVSAGEKAELKVGSTRILMLPSSMLIESGSVTIRGNPININ